MIDNPFLRWVDSSKSNSGRVGVLLINFMRGPIELPFGGELTCILCQRQPTLSIDFSVICTAESVMPEYC